MVGNPIVSGVQPAAAETSAPLKPIVQIVLKGPSLIDPRSFSAATFALYGPGDVVYKSGPGTILNSGIQKDPYTLIDDTVIRERIEGTYRIYTSGFPPISGVQVADLGTDGTLLIAEFQPAVPLNPYTEYTAVLVGEDALAWSTSTQIFPGVTSWTSDAQFTPSGLTSGVVDVINSYSRTLPSVVWDSGTGYNDTYTLIITSGSDAGAPKFLWSQLSSPGQYASAGMGPHDLGEGLTFEFSGIFVSGEQYDIDVYIPQALEQSAVWSFSTSNISGELVPVTPVDPPLIIDQTPGGGFGPVDSTTADILLVASVPAQLDYGVPKTLPYILLKMNSTLSGVNTSGITIRQTPLMGMPNASGAGTIIPSLVEVSGVFLKLWL